MVMHRHIFLLAFCTIFVFAPEPKISNNQEVSAQNNPASNDNSWFPQGKMLYDGITNNNHEWIKTAFQAGANANSFGRDKRAPKETPLYYALFRRYYEVAEILIERGALVNKPITKKGGTCLHVAIGTGNFLMAEWLLAHGADVNAQDEFGRSPIHIAASQGNLKCVELLVQAKACLTERDIRYLTPGGCAREAGHKIVAYYLENALENPCDTSE